MLVSIGFFDASAYTIGRSFSIVFLVKKTSVFARVMSFVSSILPYPPLHSYPGKAFYKYLVSQSQSEVFRSVVFLGRQQITLRPEDQRGARKKKLFHMETTIALGAKCLAPSKAREIRQGRLSRAPTPRCFSKDSLRQICLSARNRAVCLHKKFSVSLRAITRHTCLYQTISATLTFIGLLRVGIIVRPAEPARPTARFLIRAAPRWVPASTRPPARRQHRHRRSRSPSRDRPIPLDPAYIREQPWHSPKRPSTG